MAGVLKPRRKIIVPCKLQKLCFIILIAFCFRGVISKVCAERCNCCSVVDLETEATRAVSDSLSFCGDFHDQCKLSATLLGHALRVKMHHTQAKHVLWVINKAMFCSLRHKHLYSSEERGSRRFTDIKWLIF